MQSSKLAFFVCMVFAVLLNNATIAGPILGATCQAGCAALAVACYSAAGFTFGTVVAAAGTPAVIIACNTAFGTCMSACAAAYLMPTP